MNRDQKIALGFDGGGVWWEDPGETMTTEATARWRLDPERVEQLRLRFWRLDAHRAAPPGTNAEELEADFWREFGSEFNLPHVLYSDYIALTEQCIRPYEGALELLRRVAKSGVPLALVSNQTEYWANRIRRKLALDSYIPPERQIWSYQTGYSKSSPTFAMFRAFQTAVGGLPAERLVLFDDRVGNIRRCNEFGSAGILVPTGGNPVPYQAAVLHLLGVL